MSTISSPDSGKVLVVSTDLMDRSKFMSAFAEVETFRNVDALIRARPGPDDSAFVDVRLLDTFDRLREISAKVTVYGSHVDRDVFQAAQTAGVAMVARSKLFGQLQRYR